jgi:AcrR family transcriptional regulator
MPTDDPALPLYVQQAWGLDVRPRRGPKPALTLDAVVQAGIEVAGDEGIGSVSMARIAARLDASTMALYRYVASKDDLLVLMVDRAYGPAPGAHRARGWRAGLQRWASAAREVHARHPWTLRVPIRGIPLTPNQLRWLDDALRCLARTGLREQEKLSCLLLLSGFVRNAATLELDLAESGALSGSAPPPSVTIGRLIDPVEFPALAVAIGSGDLDDDADPGLDDEFEFELARVLDGIAVLVDERRA